MSNSEINTIYEQMWAQFQADAEEGQPAIDLPPNPGDARWGVSYILKLHQDRSQLTTRLAQAAKELAALTGGHQLFYDQDTFHTTVRSIEPFRDVAATDEKVNAYREILHDLSSSFGPIIINYLGLTAHKATVMAQGWPVNDTLQKVRKQMAVELSRRNLQLGPEAQSLRTTAHASLVVFTGGVPQLPELVQYIAQNRNTDYGPARINKLELVKYTRTLSNVVINTLASVELTGHHT